MPATGAPVELNSKHHRYPFVAVITSELPVSSQRHESMQLPTDSSYPWSVWSTRTSSSEPSRTITLTPVSPTHAMRFDTGE